MRVVASKALNQALIKQVSALGSTVSVGTGEFTGEYILYGPNGNREYIVGRAAVLRRARELKEKQHAAR